YFRLSKNPELLDVLPVIVPPVWHKEFNEPFLRQTWRSVFRSLSRATSLRIIGYSLPKEDQFARFVLRRALRNNILKASKGQNRPLRVYVGNPDAAVAATFSRLGGLGNDETAKFVKFQFIHASFENYLSWLLDEQG
ncbi:MAG: hypothetical protein ABSF45_07385, partial [Terriglobia bacterium]